MDRKIEARIFPFLVRGVVDTNDQTYADDMEVKLDPELDSSDAWIRVDDLPDRYEYEEALCKKSRFLRTPPEEYDR